MVNVGCDCFKVVAQLAVPWIKGVFVLLGGWRYIYIYLPESEAQICSNEC